MPPAISARKLARLYTGHYKRGYVTGKVLTDPLYPAVSTHLLPVSHPLLDIGCGMGLFAFCLRQQGWKLPILGIDSDAEKIEAANKIAAAQSWPDTQFRQVDIREGLPPHAGSVTVLDVLQYLTPAQQAGFLREAASRVVPGGVFILRSGLASKGWRYALTKLGDRLAERTGWMRAQAVHYPAPEFLEETLADCGLEGTVEPLWGRTPFNNWLAAFRRLQAPGAALPASHAPPAMPADG